MKKHLFSIAGALLACVALNAEHPSAAAAPDHQLHRPGQIVWKNGPASLPAGAQFAVLDGDPTAEGPFTMRIRVPDGYRIPPHTHPKTERVTVISGSFNLGMGSVFDAATTEEMPAGTYGWWHAGMKHFAWAKGETIVQLHGIGPWVIVYVNPEDDPRNAR